jgi:hypothetical protein
VQPDRSEAVPCRSCAATWRGALPGPTPFLRHGRRLRITAVALERARLLLRKPIWVDYTVAALLPIVGFSVPWEAIRVLVWIWAGFSEQTTARGRGQVSGRYTVSLLCRQLRPASRNSTTRRRSNTARGLPIAAPLFVPCAFACSRPATMREPKNAPEGPGNPGMCRALVRAHHKLHGTLGAANPRFIQREVFANGSVKPSAE